MNANCTMEVPDTIRKLRREPLVLSVGEDAGRASSKRCHLVLEIRRLFKGTKGRQVDRTAGVRRWQERTRGLGTCRAT